LRVLEEARLNRLVVRRRAATFACICATLLPKQLETRTRRAPINEYDVDDIAKAIERRPLPSYEERMAVFSPTGGPEPSRDLFPKVG
jgi:hypothetical protein